MRKRIISFICILLASICLFSACKSNKVEDSSSNNSSTSGGGTSGDSGSVSEEINYDNDGYGSPSVSTNYDLSKDVEGTIHIFNVSTTNYKIVTDGQSNYKILLPENPNDFESYAASELQYFFKQSTGIELAIENESSDKQYTSSDKYLAIGNTTLKQACGVSFDYETLRTNGFKIDTYGQSVIMAGSGKQGTLYSVYEFLHQVFGWENYGPDCTVYEKGVKNLALPDFNIVDVPDIEWRQVTAGLLSNEVYSRRMRYNQVGEVMAYPGGWCHNTFHAVNPAVYKNSNPEWFARDTEGNVLGGDLSAGDLSKGNLCYTCEDEGLFDVAIASLISWLEEDPSLENVTFTHQDNRDWCECEKCTAEYQKYGTHSAAVIKFINKLRRKLDPWCEENNRRVVISFFAYLDTVDAPVVKTANGYEPIDESVVCEDGVGVMYAPIEADYSKSFADPSNSRELNNLQAWSTLCDRLYLWTYATNFRSYLCPYNTYNSMQETYKLLRLNNTYWLLDQEQSYQSNCTAFNVLKYYLKAKLAWDVNADMNQLINDFFNNYFGVAAEPMRKLFNEQRARFSYIENDLNIEMFIYVDLHNKNFWPEGLLVQWLNYIDQAYSAIEAIKEEQSDLYYLIKDRILLESISYRYLLLRLYGETHYDATTLRKEQLQFKLDCSYLNVTRAWESEPINDWMASNWGI